MQNESSTAPEQGYRNIISLRKVMKSGSPLRVIRYCFFVSGRCSFAFNGSPASL